MTTQIEKKGDFLCEDPGSYYVRVFSKIASGEANYVRNSEVGKFIEGEFIISLLKTLPRKNT